MARHDIERMIAEALGQNDEATAEVPSPPRRPLPHGQQILIQYVKLCEEPNAPPDPSGDVELPAAPAPVQQPDDKDQRSFVKKALARIKR